ncbi:unnamed protein product [Orchesella dallaii]|uniref:non-specific serine/threonine protein kinase n=1 Tax=Orchesella dallaii TaxID=48710 RepID=A0ABP1RCH3_9HEXA
MNIGSGSYGEIYLASNITNEEEQVAVKVERALNGALLPNEGRIYRTLQGLADGIPEYKWYGHDEDGYLNILVIELLGPSLENCFENCSRQFTVKTVLMLADQILTTLEFLHEMSFIHRDIKPENFMMGRGSKKHKVFMIDFGFGKKYRDPRTLQHTALSRYNNLVGTVHYTSVNMHQGIEGSRRDDLESLAYMLIYFLRGDLPWQDIKGRNKKQRYDSIMECKLATPIEQLCKGLPPEFTAYLRYCRRLTFDEAPDYKYIRHLFGRLARRRGFRYDYEFDWLKLKEEQQKVESPCLI